MVLIKPDPLLINAHMAKMLLRPVKEWSVFDGILTIYWMRPMIWNHLYLHQKWEGRLLAPWWKVWPGEWGRRSPLRRFVCFLWFTTKLALTKTSKLHKLLHLWFKTCTVTNCQMMGDQDLEIPVEHCTAFGQLVTGPPGAGKSTYCHGLHQACLSIWKDPKIL